MLREYKDKERVTLYGVVESVVEKQGKNKKPFVSITISADGKTARCFKWQCTKTQAAVKQRDIVQIDGTIDVYKENGSKSLHVDKIIAIKSPSQDLIKKILPSLSKTDEKHYIDELQKLVESIEDEEYKSLVKSVLRNAYHGFVKSPAAKKNHDAFIGGLLKHTVNVTTIAAQVAQHYGGAIDRSLLIAGAIIHDIGKIKFYNIDIGGIDISTEGVMLDHVFLSLEMLRDIVGEHGPAISEEKMLMLKHIIVSHHGQKDWGALNEPCFPEAMIVHLADMIDSNMVMMQRALDDVEPGNVTEDRIFPFGRKLYRRTEEI